MNKAKRTAKGLHAGLVVTCSKKGLQVSTSTTAPDVVNTVLNALYQFTLVCTKWNNNKKEMYNLLSTAFANFLAKFAPEYYFTDEKTLRADMQDELERMQKAIDAGQGTDIDFEALKAKQKERIADAQEWRDAHPDEVL